MIKTLNWDSNFFNFSVGIIKTDGNNVDFKNIKKNASDFKLIYIFSEKPLNFKELVLVDIKVVFCKKINYMESLLKNEKIVITDYDKDLHNYEKLLQLAYLSGEYSRFKIDDNFPRSAFNSLYKKWLDNSLNNKIADKVYITTPTSSIIPNGFISFKVIAKTCIIGLISVDINTQKSGIGKTLINKVEEYCFINKIENIEVATQMANFGANKFYKKCNFKIKSKTYIYHLWQ